MAHVTIELAKRQVNLDEVTSEDEYLQHLLEAAESHVSRITRRSIDELITKYGEDTDDDGVNDDLPSDIKHAILLVVAHWYNQREAVSAVQMHGVPLAMESILRPYKKLRYSRQSL